MGWFLGVVPRSAFLGTSREYLTLRVFALWPLPTPLRSSLDPIPTLSMAAPVDAFVDVEVAAHAQHGSARYHSQAAL